MSGECDKCGEHAVDCECEIEKIIPLPLPFDPDAKIFHIVDGETGEVLDAYSYNEGLQRMRDMAGFSEDLLGHADITCRANPENHPILDSKEWNEEDLGKLRDLWERYFQANSK
jgi:hypothetical protein